MISERFDSISRVLARPGRSVPSALVMVFVAMLSGCSGVFPPAEPINPFRDLPAITLNGEPQALTTTVVPLGTFTQGDVFRINVNGEGIEAVLILTEDSVFAEAGMLAGGGPANAFFEYRVRVPGRYFVFVQFDPRLAEAERAGTITAMAGDAGFEPPSSQSVVVVFEDGFLSGPGLFDPASGSAEDQAFFASLESTVRVEIMGRLRTIFADTPVMIFEAGDALPAGPVSRLTFQPDRVLAEGEAGIDATLPAADPSRPECQVGVIFGEVLPRGAKLDAGNRNPADEAAVYVGSFQGRGPTCRTAVINSVSNMVLTLAQAGAHEIGHLIGLYHVELVDIMNRTATVAFQRELPFARGQIQMDAEIDGAIVPQVLTVIIQDPAFYFRAAFGG